MSRIVYDVSMFIGVALVSGGTWAQFGGGISAIVTGALVIAVTFAGAAAR